MDWPGENEHLEILRWQKRPVLVTPRSPDGAGGRQCQHPHVLPTTPSPEILPRAVLRGDPPPGRLFRRATGCLRPLGALGGGDMTLRQHIVTL